MKRFTTVLAVVLMGPVLIAAGSGTPSRSTSTTLSDPRAIAVQYYQDGQRQLDRAAKLQQELKASSDSKAATKLQQKIEKSLERAAGDFKRAVSNDPNLFQAHSELGFALRRLGQFDQSLAAYDRALKIQPNFSPAIEYRAEAYLGLNRLDEAKQAYTLLFSGDRARADLLFNAMKEWLAERRANPAGFDPQQIEQFASWVEQREAVHRQTSDLSSSSSSTVRSW